MLCGKSIVNTKIFVILVYIIWNNITDKIDTDTSLLTFKKQLKVLLFTDEITIPLES